MLTPQLCGKQEASLRAGFERRRYQTISRTRSVTLSSIRVPLQLGYRSCTEAHDRTLRCGAYRLQPRRFCQVLALFRRTKAVVALRGGFRLFWANSAASSARPHVGKRYIALVGRPGHRRAASRGFQC